jgi:hypothetical protein
MGWIEENISRPTRAEMIILRSTEGKTKKEIRNKKSRDNLNMNTLEGELVNNRTVWACFKNEHRQNSKECFQHANKRKIPKKKTETKM